MFSTGTRLTGVFPNRTSVPGAAVLIVGIALLASPRSLLAQHGGGHSAPGGGSVGNNSPSGVSVKDDLKDFHRVMAVQATAQQSAAFAIIVQDAQGASAQLQAFRDLQQKATASSAASDHAASLDQAIEKARTGNRSFLASFSSAQKSGLKDDTRKLEKADSDLAKQVKMLDQIVQDSKPESEQMVNSAANLEKALASFQNELLALGREMSITLPSAGQDLTFKLPAVKNSINIAGQPISISASGAVSRTSSADGKNLFNIELIADLSDLQQNITSILRSQINRSPNCGERIEIQQAVLTPLAPSSLVVAHLRFERWMCPHVSGQESPSELAAGEGSIEVRLTPSVGQNAALRLGAEIGRVDADSFLGELLRSGSLGAELSEQIATSLLSAMQKGADLKAALPPAARQLAAIQKVQFQNAGAGQLSLVLDGQLQLSDEQTKQFATELKQRLSAQETSPP
jgi:hypothetical protein